MNRFPFSRPKVGRKQLSRRQFLQEAGAIIAAGTAAVTLNGCQTGSANGLREGEPVPIGIDPELAQGERPNIIFVLTDDHRWDHLSSMGHPFLQTPNIDRLADEGVLFENAFVTTSLCSPSRASFLTGQYAHTHGVQNNLTEWDQAQNITYFETLAQGGYRNGFIGKWHMPGRLPNLRGVEQFITFTVQGGQGRYFDCPLLINGVETARPDTYITTDLTDFALAFIEERQNDPFCLYLSHKAVHHQFFPPPELDDLYAAESLDFLPDEQFSLQTMLDRNLWEGALGPMETHYRNYCEALVAVDQELGRLMTRLEELNLLDNTLIVYSGDNGYSWGEHNVNGKRWATEENMRVPFIVRGPGVNTAGQRRSEMVLNLDLAPTLLEIANIPIPAAMEGASVRPLLQGETPAWREEFLYEYFQDFPYNIPVQNALRTAQYLYVEYGQGRPPELFDIIADPETQHNIIDTPAGQAVVPELQQRLQAQLEV